MAGANPGTPRNYKGGDQSPRLTHQDPPPTLQLNFLQTSCTALPPPLTTVFCHISAHFLHFFYFLVHGGCPPASITQKRPNHGQVSVHGEPKFIEGQQPAFLLFTGCRIIPKKTLPDTNTSMHNNI